MPGISRQERMVSQLPLPTILCTKVCKKDLHTFPSRGFGELRSVFKLLSLNTSLFFLLAWSTQLCSFAWGREWWRRKKGKGGLYNATETDKSVRRFRVHYQS